jgi:hypothetical protein
MRLLLRTVVGASGWCERSGLHPHWLILCVPPGGVARLRKSGVVGGGLMLDGRALECGASCARMSQHRYTRVHHPPHAGTRHRVTTVELESTSLTAVLRCPRQGIWG